MKYTLKPVESWFSSLKHKVMDKKKNIEGKTTKKMMMVMLIQDGAITLT